MVDSPYPETSASPPIRKNGHISGRGIGLLILVPAVLAGALYLDSLSGAPSRLPSAASVPPRPEAASVPGPFLRTLERRVTAIERRLEKQDAPAPVTAEISPALERELHDLRAEIAALKAAAPAMDASHEDSLLVAIYKLEKTALSGMPFTAPLDVLLENPALPEVLHRKLQPLTTAARRGIASYSTLIAFFEESMEAYRSGAVAASAQEGSVWDQVKRNFSSLITIRKLGDANGTGDEAALARAEAAIAEEAIAAAIDELSQLGEDTLPYFEDWLAQARRRQKTLRVIERARESLERGASVTSPPSGPGNV